MQWKTTLSFKLLTNNPMNLKILQAILLLIDTLQLSSTYTSVLREEVIMMIHNETHNTK